MTVWLPLPGCLLPNEPLRKVLIGDLLCTQQSGIGNKPLCERSLFNGFTIHKHLWVVIVIIEDILFIFNMDGQTIDRWLFLMHGKFHDVPDSLGRPNVTGAYVIHYLINIFSHSHCGAIVTLVYVLVNVLDGLDRGTDLNVYMAFVPGGQGWIVGNDMVVAKGLTSGIGIGPSIIWPGILRIAILTKTCLRTELLWKMLAANSIDHARCIGVFWTARTMDHALCDSGIELGMSNRVRDLSRYNGVNMGCITDLKLALQKYEEVDVGQTTLLKLYGEDKALDLSEKLSFISLSMALISEQRHVQ